MEHVSLSLVIGLVYAAVVLGTYLVVRRWFPERVALASAMVTGAAAAFMELNFLQPTPFFYLTGLLTFDFTLRYWKSMRLKELFWAGLALGAGLAFKASAAFYGLAVALYLLAGCLLGWSSFISLITEGATFACGTLVIPCALALYFFAHGRLVDFWQWTFVFPVLHYPANTVYLAKAYTKLLWVHLLILGAVPLLVSKGTRRAAFGHAPTMLSLLFGVCSYLALLKTQASHYFFPGAPFLMLFALHVYDRGIGAEFVSSRSMRLGLTTAAAGVLALLLVSVVLYRPDALRRLAQVRDFEAEERPIREFIQANVDPAHYVLFGGGAYASTWGYWVSHRYPPPPFISDDVKTIWMLRNQPERVFAVLADPRLALVQFEPDEPVNPRLEDVFGDRPGDYERMAEYLLRVRHSFTRVSGPYAPLTADATYWLRSNSR
jgi:hypothetical protein